MARDPSTKRSRRSVRIGKYEVVAHVATGGMGAVYRAIDTDLRREVALKVLNPEMAARPGALERFRREARHAAKLRHENIVTIYEFGNEGPTWFLALEFVEGIDLQEYISRKGKLDPEEARLIALQAARALNHAHKHGIIHRDIKPSNFLVCRKGDKLLVKMSDFGLAREMTDEEARVTRDGTTVGTVDYMSPEQARDSGKADIRSDIYSLGCTLFHMLAGRPPFTGGGMGERLYKHISEEPPDLRQFNPRISEALVAVVRRMLAKKPEERYQTPRELMKELQQLEVTAASAGDRDILAGLAMAAEGPDEPSAPERRGRPSSSATRRAATPRRRDEAEDEMTAAVPARGRRSLLPFVVGGLVAALVVGVGIAVLLSGDEPGTAPERREARGPSATEEPDLPPPDTGRTVPAPASSPAIPAPPGGAAMTSRSPWPALFDPPPVVPTEQLWKETLAPWATDRPPPSDAPIHRVARLPGDGPGHFASVEAACAAAPADRTTVIEVHDNGPLFVRPFAVSGRRLVLRGGKGYRPLLVWDIDRGQRDEVSALVSVTRGALTLEGLELALRWPDLPSEARTFLVRVTDSDFLARDCVFSQGGRHLGGVATVRFERSDPAAPTPAPAPRCRLSHCCVRGSDLTALDLDAPGAEVLLDGCFVVGSRQPLLQLTGRGQAAPSLRLVRSTLIGGVSAIHLAPAGGREDLDPRLNGLAWDVLVSRGGGPSGGVMLHVTGGARLHQVHWRLVNCLYAGWPTLLQSAEEGAADARRWQVTWGLKSGSDAAILPPWPGAMPHDAGQVVPEAYRPAPYPASPVGYAATSGSGPLGHDPDALPTPRTSWLAFAGDGFPLPAVSLPTDRAPPELPSEVDMRYHGGMIDLARTNLGAHLDQMARTRGLARRVVLSLVGSGNFKTKAIRVKGSDLVLHFQPPEEGMPPPVLSPDETSAPTGDALIEVDGGNLELTALEVQCPDYKLALLPPYVIKVRGGDLRMLRCRITGPKRMAPDLYRGLVLFEGGEATAARNCALNETVLVSGKTVLHVRGGGAHLRLAQCVLVSSGDALHLDPGPRAAPRLDLTCALEQTTLAANRSVVHLTDAPHLATVVEPMVVTAQASAFLNPFPDAPTATLLAVEGQALARGLLGWQGENSVYDRRLAREVLQLTTPERKPYAGPGWAALGGSAWSRGQVFDLPLTRTLDWERLPLERLALPALKPVPGEGKRPHPGADLEALGLVKPPEKPRKPR